MPAPNDQKRDRSLLANFSVTQIVVAGLAAATSFALSSQIGIAGSAIGAAVGAVASAAASQIYRNLIDASAERLRNRGDSGEGSPEAEGQATTPMREAPDQTTPWQPASLSGRVTVDDVAESGTPIAPREVRYAARAREQARIRRRVAIVGAVVGIVAVLSFALVTYVATQGAGIGQTASERPAVEEETTQGGASPTAPVQSTPEDTSLTDSTSEETPSPETGSSSGASDGSSTGTPSGPSAPADGTSGSDSVDGGSASSPDPSDPSSSSGTGEGSSSSSSGSADASSSSAS